jgi:nitrate reductase beta subunit
LRRADRSSISSFHLADLGGEAVDTKPYLLTAGNEEPVALALERMLAMRAYMFVIFLGHFVGLLTPIQVFDALGISHTSKQWMAIGIGGLASAMLIP